jgi:hypothetical protein
MNMQSNISKEAQQQLNDISVITDAVKEIGGTLNIRFIAAKIVKVIKNTKSEWCATYADNYGTYKFSLKKKGGKYYIESDGMKFGGYSDLDGVIWNYECQLGQVRKTALVITKNIKGEKS